MSNNETIKLNKKVKGVSMKNIGKLGKYCGYAAAAAGMFVIGIDAFAWNINAGVDAGVNPLIEAINAHWGKGVALSAVTTAMLSEGDPRTRAVRALIGGGAAGAVILGIIATAG